MFRILAQLKLSQLTPLFLSEWEKVAQSCLTLCDRLDYTIQSMEFSWPEYWSTFPFSRGPSQPRNWTQVSWHPTPVLLPGKSHGWRNLVGCSPWGHWELDMTQWLHFHFSLSCIGEGSGNPLQHSCLENPRNGGAWWAAVCEVTQSQTRLKWLSSSSFRLRLIQWFDVADVNFSDTQLVSVL